MIFTDPSREQWSRLRPPLTPGEGHLGDLLRLGLSSPWELYVQPHLNGLRPDFVLVHPSRGVLVLEVKDWADQAKDGRSLASTLGKVARYGEELRDLYCPSLGRGHEAHVSSHLILPYHPRSLLLRSLTEADLRSDSRIFTSEDLGPELVEQLAKILPSPSPEAEEAYRDLRHWLVEPEFNTEQREALEVDDRQKELIRTRTTRGLRRIRGPAGSGKSLVLAARAAELAREGKDVLVVTYNITLLNYLRDLAVRWPKPSLPTSPIRENVTWLNFHQWCKRVCKASHRTKEYNELWSGDHNSAFEEGVANLTREILQDGCDESMRYDAVLVDEGQDFTLSWWEALRFAVKPDGEMLLVADSSQDLYGHAESWTEEAMLGAGFSGPWTELHGSYRLPPRVLTMAREFLREYLADNLAILPEPVQFEIPLGPTHLSWIQVTAGDDIVATCVTELWEQLQRLDDLGIAELVFLASTNDVGRAVVKELETRNVRVRHTFEEEGRPSRDLKRAFFKGDARVKATTLHSFKGWESRAIVLHIGRQWGNEAMAAVYAGLTRVRKSSRGCILSVVCEQESLTAFGQRWSTPP